jgi:hypothetical protein
MVKGYVDGQYVLEKTPVDNQYVFYRRDRKTLRDGDVVIARRMLIIFGIGECIYGKRPGDSLDNIKSKISEDSRFLDLILLMKLLSLLSMIMSVKVRV